MWLALAGVGAGGFGLILLLLRYEFSMKNHDGCDFRGQIHDNGGTCGL